MAGEFFLDDDFDPPTNTFVHRSSNLNFQDAAGSSASAAVRSSGGSSSGSGSSNSSSTGSIALAVLCAALIAQLIVWALGKAILARRPSSQQQLKAQQQVWSYLYLALIPGRLLLVLLPRLVLQRVWRLLSSTSSRGRQQQTLDASQLSLKAAVTAPSLDGDGDAWRRGSPQPPPRLWLRGDLDGHGHGHGGSSACATPTAAAASSGVAPPAVATPTDSPRRRGRQPAAASRGAGAAEPPLLFWSHQGDGAAAAAASPARASPLRGSRAAAFSFRAPAAGAAAAAASTDSGGSMAPPKRGAAQSRRAASAATADGHDAGPSKAASRGARRGAAAGASAEDVSNSVGSAEGWDQGLLRRFGGAQAAAIASLDGLRRSPEYRSFLRSKGLSYEMAVDHRARVYRALRRADPDGFATLMSRRDVVEYEQHPPGRLESVLEPALSAALTLALVLAPRLAPAGLVPLPGARLLAWLLLCALAARAGAASPAAWLLGIFVTRGPHALPAGTAWAAACCALDAAFVLLTAGWAALPNATFRAYYGQSVVERLLGLWPAVESARPARLSNVVGSGTGNVTRSP